jgi:hypothetical protein
MKTFLSSRGTAALALLVGGLATSARSAELSKPASPVAVTFSDPDNYTDSELSDGAYGYREPVFTAVRSFLSTEGERMLPPGYHLTITFTDIDLGHRTAHRQSSLGAPCFEFTYQVTDPAGAVVRHGTENLKNYTDFADYRRSVLTTDLTTEVIQRDKPMLKNWAVTALAGLKQG